MEIQGKVVVVTGGGHGIGRALCGRFATDGAETVVVADVDRNAAQQVAVEIGGHAVGCDVSVESDVRNLVEQAVQLGGRIDLFCSNAGIAAPGGFDAADEEWMRQWNIHVMAHVYAARAVLPMMVERGSGYLLQTASAAGLLSEMGSAPYSVTKHAAVAFAEWLSIRYRDAGIGVSCLCPMGVSTKMLEIDDPHVAYLRLTAIEPSDVADAVVAGLRDERFLILPHPEVADFFKFKAADYDRWLKGMRRLHNKLTGNPQSRRK